MNKNEPPAGAFGSRTANIRGRSTTCPPEKLFQSRIETQDRPCFLVTGNRRILLANRIARLNYQLKIKCLAQQRFSCWDVACCSHSEQLGLKDPCPIARVFSGELSAQRELKGQISCGNPGWIRCNAVPVFNSEGKIVYGIVTLTDLTKPAGFERRTCMLNWLKSLKLWQISLWELDVKHNTITWYNRSCDADGKETTFQETVEDWLSMVHEEDRDAACKQLHAHIEGKNDYYETEYRMLTRDGRWHWFKDVGTTAIRDENGRAQLLTGLFVNIDSVIAAKKRQADMNTLLEQKNKELQNVVYVLSHDLRSPLVNIHGFSVELEKSCNELTELVRIADKTPEHMTQIDEISREQLPESLHYISQSINKMDSLLKSLVEFSRIGRTALRQDHIDMNGLIQQVYDAQRYQIVNSGIDVDIESLPDCVGDIIGLDQVFSNLLSNAIKYLDDSRKGRITISGRVVGDKSVYSVKDNGVGISPDQQPKIFEMFHRIDPEGKIPGQGLGLATVKQILDRHAGRIWVESTPGKGSEFFVALPKSLP